MNSRTKPDPPDGWDDARLADAYRALAGRARLNGCSARAIVLRATAEPRPRALGGWSPRRRWASVVGLIAAAVMVAAVVVAPRAIVTAPASPGIIPGGSPVAPAAGTPAATDASASPSVAPIASPSSTPTAAPPATVPILGAAALTDLVSREQAGGLAPAWVVTSAPMGVAAGTPGFPSIEECWPTGTCRVIGSINGAGVVAIREQDRLVEPPMPTGDTPIVLRVAPDGPLEYLGQLDAASAGAPLTASALSKATDHATPGEVVAVRAWLDAGHEVFAGPARPDDEPMPFVGQENGAWLAGSAFLPITGGGGGFSGNGPHSGAVQVQSGAYSQFAPDPADADQYNYQPRDGLWLVRFVEHHAADYGDEHGWLLVGRIDAAPRAAPPSGRDVPGYPRVLSAQEAANVVTVPGSEGQGVLVDGKINSISRPPCTADLCLAGVLSGTKVEVWTSRETRSFARPTFDSVGISAYRVRKGGLAFLGWMGYAADGTFTDTLGDLEALANPPTPDSPSAPSGPVTFVVRGWLVDQGVPISCLTMPDDGWPFGCGGAWITPEAYQPGKGGNSNAVPPSAGIEVEPGAYDAYAPDPAWLPNGIAHAPREGTWLVRLLTGSAGQRAWEVVAHLAR